MNTFRKWLISNIEEESMQDLAEHGADAGWNGMIYYHECKKAYDIHEEEIWEALAMDAEDFGYKSVPEFIATFNRADMADDLLGFTCLLVWYMAEREAHMWVDEQEEVA